MGVSLTQSVDGDFELRYVEYSPTIAYLGKAAINSPNSAPVWQIKKLDYSNGIVINWADGNSNFDNVWDDRETLSYTN